MDRRLLRTGVDEPLNSNFDIVVADDNRDAADSLVELLTLLGYSACAAYDGLGAVHLCDRCHPVLVILDVEMPLRNGCEAARDIRAMIGQKTPTLASLTCLAANDEPMHSEGGVFDVHLAKPVRFDELSDLLATIRPSSFG